MRQNSVFVLLGILISGSLAAQQHVDLVSAGIQHKPGAKLNSGAQFTESNLTANVLIPLQRKNGDAFLTGVNFEYAAFRFPGQSRSRESYLPTRFIAGYQFKFNDRNSLTLLALPSIKSNWNNINKHHIQYAVYARYDRLLNPNLKLKTGLYLNAELSGLFLVPLISLDYYGAEKWDFYGVFPVNYNILYSLTPRFRAGARYEGLLNTIYTDQHQSPGYWERAPLNFMCTAEFDLSEYLVVRASAGHSFLRSVKRYGIQEEVDFRFSAAAFGDNRTELDDAGDAPVFELSLIFRYRNP